MKNNIKTIKEKNKGIILITCSALCFSLMSLMVKLSGDVPSIQKTFFRNSVSLVIAFALILAHKESFFGKKENQPYLLGRSIFGTLGIVANYYAIDNLVLSDASMLNKLSPFVVIILSYIFLKEKIKPVQLFALIFAFLGTLLIIKPGFNSNVLPSLIGFSSALLAGSAYTFVRFLGGREKYYTIVFYFSFVSIVSLLPFLILSYKPMTLDQLLYLLAAGIFASLAQFALTLAYKYAPASEISVFDYSQILFSAILGILFLNEIPDLYSFMGYLLIIGAYLGVFIYNYRRNKTAS